jgi:peptide/nickel transport system permease protein
MRLLEYIARRLIMTIPTLLGLTLLTFVISHMVPANPAFLYLGERATPEMLAEFNRAWGLDQPLYIQFIRFMIGFFQGDFGTSTWTRHPVLEDLVRYFPATLELTAGAMVVAMVFGVLFGVISAVKRNTVIDYVVRAVSLIGASMPVYWLALVAMSIAYLRLGLVSPGRLSSTISAPTHITGLYLIDSLLTLNLTTFGDAFVHLILPSTILASWIIAPVVRQTRAAMIDSLAQDYTLAAKAKGLPERVVVWKHALRNALIPTVTVIGMTFGGLLAGSVITETIFYWSGIGSYMLHSTFQVDFAAIVGGTAVIGILYTLINLVVDLLYGAIDPRIRYG